MLFKSKTFASLRIIKQRSLLNFQTILTTYQHFKISITMMMTMKNWKSKYLAQAKRLVLEKKSQKPELKKTKKPHNPHHLCQLALIMLRLSQKAKILASA